MRLVGALSSVTPDEDLEGNILNTGIITPEARRQGEIGTVAVDDICQGIFHDHTVLATMPPLKMPMIHSVTSALPAFYTCYFRVSEILESGRNSQFRYVLRPASEKAGPTGTPLCGHALCRLR